MITTKHITTDYAGNLVAAAASGESVAFPAGTYTMTGAEVFAANTKFVGQGTSTVFSVDGANSIKVGVSGGSVIQNVGFYDCTIQSSGTPDTEPVIRFNMLNYLTLSNVFVMSANRQFATLDSVNIATFENVVMGACLIGFVIGATTSSSGLNFNNVFARALSANGELFRLISARDALFVNSRVIGLSTSKAMFNVVPVGSMSTVSDIRIVGPYCNTFRGSFLAIAPTNGGIVQAVKVFGGALHGSTSTSTTPCFSLNADATSTLDDILIDGVTVNAFGQEGVYLGKCSNVVLNNNTVYGNSKNPANTYAGLNITANAANVQVTGGRYGEADAAATATQSYGIINNSTSAKIRGVNTRYNVTGGVSDAVKSIL